MKMNANENMVAEPSVGRTEGRDDYAQYGLFHHFTCNFSVDENGFNHVDAWRADWIYQVRQGAGRRG